jgi:hypothetical protein
MKKTAGLTVCKENHDFVVFFFGEDGKVKMTIPTQVLTVE